jgi:four helix bundle protein
MAYRSFEDLSVWQRACRLAVSVINQFERCVIFTLRDQTQRAALSIPSNIAEGSERGTTKEFAHFLNIAKGSCGELRTQVYIARKLKIITRADFEVMIAECRELSAMLEGLRKSIIVKTPTKRVRAQS